jgi:hypothetical protein
MLNSLASALLALFLLVRLASAQAASPTEPVALEAASPSDPTGYGVIACELALGAGAGLGSAWGVFAAQNDVYGALSFLAGAALVALSVGGCAMSAVGATDLATTNGWDDGVGWGLGTGGVAAVYGAAIGMGAAWAANPSDGPAMVLGGVVAGAITSALAGLFAGFGLRSSHARAWALALSGLVAGIVAPFVIGSITSTKSYQYGYVAPLAIGGSALMTLPFALLF